jgi:hypothetical protein
MAIRVGRSDLLSEEDTGIDADWPRRPAALNALPPVHPSATAPDVVLSDSLSSRICSSPYDWW